MTDNNKALKNAGLSYTSSLKDLGSAQDPGTIMKVLKISIKKLIDIGEEGEFGNSLSRLKPI